MRKSNTLLARCQAEAGLRGLYVLAEGKRSDTAGVAWRLYDVVSGRHLGTYWPSGRRLRTKAGTTTVPDWREALAQVAVLGDRHAVPA